MMLSDFKKLIKRTIYNKLTFQAVEDLELELKKIYPLIKVVCNGTSMTIKVVKETKHKIYEENMFNVRIYRKRTPDKNYVITDFDLNFEKERYMNVNRIYKKIVSQLNKTHKLRQQQACATLNKINSLELTIPEFETLSKDYMELKEEIAELYAN